MAFIDGNYQVICDGKAVNKTYPMPVKTPKRTTQALFGGAIEASVTEANATVIDMTECQGGSLEVKVNSGTGTFSLAFMGAEVNSGVFKQVYQENAAKSGYEAKPALVTTTEVSAVYEISGIKCNYLKLVPTLTGTANVTFKFTPNNR